MAPISVCVNYDKSTPEYYAGEMLSGNVIVTLKKAMTITDIYLKVKGKCEVRFSKIGHSHHTFYENNEVYMNEKISIFQSETLDSGQYQYPFSIQLPTKLPETFKVKAGEVAYKCKAVVKHGEKSSKCKESTPFTVHAWLPLPCHLRKMQRTEKTKKLPFLCDGCWCYTGKVTGELTIDKGGYIPGETISFNALISNKSTSALESLELTVKQTVQCNYWHEEGEELKSETEVKEIHKVECTQSIPAGSEFTWSVSMALPNSLPPTDLGACKIIYVTYDLVADVGVGSFCCAPVVQFHIPFMVCTADPFKMAPSAKVKTMDSVQLDAAAQRFNWIFTNRAKRPHIKERYVPRSFNETAIPFLG